MLRSNCLAVKNKIRAYIIENYDGEGFEPGTPEADAKTLEEISTVILSDVLRVEGWRRDRYGYVNGFRAFCDWASGLPGLLNTMYYYNVSAVDLLGDILEETEKERARFTESEAEERLSYLIYRELEKAAPGILK